MLKRLASLPTASGGLSRLAANRVRRARAKLKPLLSRVRLTIDMIDQRIDARKQIAFLEIAAEALHDKFFGFSLAEDFNCKEFGLLYYVMASSETLGGALERASRYSRITNEAIVLEYRAIPEPALRLSYSGIPRHADLQQIEFCILAMVRVSRLLSGRQFSPKRISCMRSRTEGISKFARFLGNNIELGGDSDEIVYPAGSPDWALRPRGNKQDRHTFQVRSALISCRLVPLSVWSPFTLAAKWKASRFPTKFLAENHKYFLGRQFISQ
jgi:hypothetical protein